jgi:guanylate kinase
MEPPIRKELLFVFTGPKGAGRRTVADMAGTTLGMKPVLSYTTRNPRPNEAHGRDYFFVPEADFLRALKRGEFIETDRINGYWYGVKHRDIETMLPKHRALYLVLNRRGAARLKELYGDQVIRIFISADPDTLRARQREAGLSAAETAQSMADYEAEMAYRPDCEYAFENYDIAHTVFDLTKILDRYLERNLLELD